MTQPSDAAARTFAPLRCAAVVYWLALAMLAASCSVVQTRAASSEIKSAPAQRSLARLEPPQGTYFGVNLEWGHDSAAAYAERLGYSPAVYVAFAHFPVQADEEINLTMAIDQVAEQRAMALLTLEPTIDLDAISPAMAAALVDRLRDYNARGVPVLVRFAHEMNGSWYAWSQQPQAYVRAFRLIADAVHRDTTDSAMLWAPNHGMGYPFTGGAYGARPGSQDFADLDTNHDGVLDDRDDMYAPYYPGDDAVDWVGMTLYHWGDSWPWGKNIAPEVGKFVSQLNGTYNGTGGDERLLPNFYRIYAEGHAKPMAIPETAAFYNTSAGAGDSELDVKRTWWRQVFGADVARDLPAIKMINWFEWEKPEAEVGNAIVDWTATAHPAVLDAFVADLPSERLLFAPGAVAPPPVARTESTLEPTATETIGVPPAADLPLADPDLRRRLAFAGHEWRVRSATDLEGPGPNYFSDSPEHAWVDDAGRLHLRVSPEADGLWYAAEVVSDATFGYGTYEFSVDSRVDDLDPNVTLGLFTWSDDPAQNHRELDIEFALFGQLTGLAGRYTLQPYTEPGNVFLFAPPLSERSTHRFEWLPQRITFQTSIEGGPPTGSSEVIARHVFLNNLPEAGGEHLHINVWLDAGRAPTNGRSVEIVLRNFAFTPTK